MRKFLLLRSLLRIWLEDPNISLMITYLFVNRSNKRLEGWNLNGIRKPFFYSSSHSSNKQKLISSMLCPVWIFKWFPTRTLKVIFKKSVIYNWMKFIISSNLNGESPISSVICYKLSCESLKDSLKINRPNLSNMLASNRRRKRRFLDSSTISLCFISYDGEDEDQQISYKLLRYLVFRFGNLRYCSRCEPLCILQVARYIKLMLLIACRRYLGII